MQAFLQAAARELYQGFQRHIHSKVCVVVRGVA
jgi:hypothetical protein